MDLRISQLPETGEVLGIDLLAIVNDGITKKVSVTQLLDLAVSKDYVDTQDALKVDKVDNERLINADEISKLEGIEAGAEVNVNADWNATIGDAVILNKPIIPSIEGLATETYVNDKVSSVLRYKGSVANYESLPTIDLVIGDTWNLLDTGMNYAYTGVVGALWDALGGTVTVGGFVPYTGAIANVDLGEHQLKAGQFEFDQTPTGAFNAGMVRWNDSDGTTERKLKGGNVTLQDGQEIVKRVVNKTGANLLESQYKVVRIRTAAEGGSQGQRSAIVLAQANNNLNSNATLGVVTESILNNEEGFITLLGEVRQINTTGSLQGETWLDGDQLYLSATISGGLTKVVPASPYYSIPVATIDYAHAINGKISVNISKRLALDTTLAGNNDTAPSVTAVRTYVDNKVAIKTIDEGNGIGYVIANRNPLNYGNVGFAAVDLSYSNAASNNLGATGLYSFASGYSSTASGNYSIASGIYSTASGQYSFANGSVSTASGIYSTASGYNSNAKSLAETAIGTYNTNYNPVSAMDFEPLDRLFGVGNGINNTLRSDALIILKNGLTTLPSVTNALITAEPTGKAVVTKSYLEENYTPINTPVRALENESLPTALNTGLLRYKSDATNSYVDMVMQIAPTVYEWVNIVANTDDTISGGGTTPVADYSDYVTASNEISTTSLTDVIATGMAITPPAGAYKVDFSANYGIVAGNVCSVATLDLQVLYLTLLNLPATATHGLTFGSGEILGPGIYTVAGAMSVAGTLTLDGQGDPNALFVVRASGAINTAISTSILLTNGANAANVFLVAVGAVGVGADNEINGNFIAYGAAAALGANCTFTGRLFSTQGALAFGAGILKRPPSASVIEMGILENFMCFTSDGNVSNTAIAVITGDLGTDLGLVSVFANTVFNGTAYDNTQKLGITNVFSIYNGNDMILNSDRKRFYNNFTEDISLVAIVVSDGTTPITIRWRTDLGRVSLKNRILTLKTF